MQYVSRIPIIPASLKPKKKHDTAAWQSQRLFAPSKSHDSEAHDNFELSSDQSNNTLTKIIPIKIEIANTCTHRTLLFSQRIEDFVIKIIQR